ncbi:MAG: hypothetical protein RJB36_1141 [Bacteroidota bacterium]|jgi:hypothetical protein
MEQTNTTTTRPTFLTVLCILTWVGSGIGLISGLIGIIGASALEGIDMGDSALNATMENAKMIQYASLVCIILCIVGSVMMWQMKKTGFYLYLVGELAPLALSFLMLGSIGAASGLAGGAMAAAGAIAAIFPIAFVVMYALNLKHMK